MPLFGTERPCVDLLFNACHHPARLTIHLRFTVREDRVDEILDQRLMHVGRRRVRFDALCRMSPRYPDLPFVKLRDVKGARPAQMPPLTPAAPD